VVAVPFACQIGVNHGIERAITVTAIRPLNRPCRALSSMNASREYGLISMRSVAQGVIDLAVPGRPIGPGHQVSRVTGCSSNSCRFGGFARKPL
jgi:hypothetical protein